MNPVAIIFKFLPDKIKLRQSIVGFMALGHLGNKTLLLSCMFYDLYYANQNTEEYWATADFSKNVDR